VKISADEAFMILHKWQVELIPIVFVGSLMTGHPLRGRIAVVTRDGVWETGEKPASIWGFSLTGEGANFLASKFDGFEYLQPSELPSDVKKSLPEMTRERGVLALTKTMTMVRPRGAEGDRLSSVEETLFLVEDDPLGSA
jgi:hypothetical protein